MTVRVLLGQQRQTSVRLRVSPIADAIAGLRWSAWSGLAGLRPAAAGVLHCAGAERPYRRRHMAGSLCPQPSRSLLASILEDDLHYRMNRLTHDGLAGLFADLHSLVSLGDRALTVATRCDADPIRADDELMLVPSVTCHRVLILDSGAGSPPLLVYPARGGAGRDAEAQTMALRALLSRVPLGLLSALNEPMRTAELAERSRASQAQTGRHLATLESAGLTASARPGEHHRTPLGTLLVSPFCRDCI